MNERERERLAAYCRSGHDAYDAVATRGHDIGGGIVRGSFEAWLLGHAAIFGWEQTLELVREHARGKYVPPRGKFLHLAVSNSAEIVHGSVPKAG